MIHPTQLVEDASGESSEIEFKRLLPGKSDKERHEFLKDVTAFANDRGGVIYYGIVEEKGRASALCAIPDSDFDAEARRLGQILDSGIEPRLHGAEFRKFEIDGGYVLALRVPPSLNGPFRMSVNGQSKFFVRANTHVAEMTYDQLRRAFALRSNLVEEAKREWRETIERLSNGETPRPMPEGPLCVVQLLPLTSLAGSELIDVRAAYSDFGSFMMSSWGGASNTFNLDGALFYSGRSDDTVPFYTQVHRSGRIETVRVGGHVFREEKIIPSQIVAEFFREAISRFADYVTKYDIPAPYVLNAAMLKVSDYRLGIDNRYHFFERMMTDRAALVFPSVFIEDQFKDRSEVLSRNLLDVMWQSFGLAACDYYDAEGNWLAR